MSLLYLFLRSRELDRRHNNFRSIFSSKVDNMLALVQIFNLLLDVAWEVRARVQEALDSEEEAFASLETYAHGPKGNFELNNFSFGYLFLNVMGMVRNQICTQFMILSAVRSSQNASRSRVLINLLIASG